MRVVVGLLVVAIGIGAFYAGRASKDERPAGGSFAAGRESAFNGFDGGWTYGQPYVDHAQARRSGRDLRSSRAAGRSLQVDYRRCGVPSASAVPTEPFDSGVGAIESPLDDLDAAPKQGTRGRGGGVDRARLRVPRGLDDVRAGDRLLVLTWLHLGDRDVLRVHPRDDVTNPLRGVFSTRSASRPEPDRAA